MKYHKIPYPFYRDVTTNKLTRIYISKEVEELSETNWIFTDKIDGTNVRVMWDGYNLEFAGRTEKSELPKKLLEKLKSIFVEEFFEQKFGDMPVILFGEGYGGKIQGGIYKQEEDFILFDVYIGDVFLERKNVDDIAKSFKIKSVPIMYTGSIQGGVSFVEENDLVEGLVGVPKGNFLDRKGHRIIVKIKNKDFK